MKISIIREGFTEFNTELYNMSRLFFDQVEIVYEPDDTADYSVWLTLGERSAGQWQVSGQLTRTTADGERVSWTAVRERRSGTDDHERRPVIRRLVCSVYLRMFQDATGLEQPWGILTGVRPTKLMHNLMLKGMSYEERIELLRDQYLVSDRKARLVADIAERQLKVIPDLFNLDNEVSIYIGIPFCPTKCAYCTFPAYAIRGQNGSVNAFLAGLHEEIREIGQWLCEAGLKVTTIYWGGGTPTSITAEEMDELFQSMHQYFPDMSSVRELTVEAGRPDTITPEKIKVMLKWKVDRISINPQSFTQDTLDVIGRHHTVVETIEKFQLARDMGIDNINMDLIIGLPGEGLAELNRSLAETSKLMPESLTVHTLSFKRASRMTKNRDEFEVAERSEIAAMMERAIEWTEEHRYVPYYLYRQKNMLGNLENVGYSLEGKESLYNILMMEERQTVIGLGCGAVSKILFPRKVREDGSEDQPIERFPNPKEPNVYNSSYQEYIDKKIKLLNEAYSLPVQHQE